MKSYLPGAVCVAILLASCATGYQKQGFTGEFSETQLGENIFQISFKGDANTSPEQASDLTLLRSAEIVVEKGFRYFTIIDSEKYSKTGTYTYSKPTTTNTIVYYKDKPEEDALVYDGSFVARSIKARYGLADKQASFASFEARSIKTRKELVNKQAFDDVKGWHKTYWGMSPGELEQMYLTNLKESCKDEAGRCIYTLQPVELYGTPVDVEFYLAKGSKLNRVRVFNKFKKGNQLKLAEQIELELKEKYGTPKVLNDEREHTEPRIAEDGRPIPGSNSLELQWVFPSTTITYFRAIRKYTATNAIVVNSVISLDYKASDNSRF